MPEGETFFCLARTISTGHQASHRGGLPQRVEKLAIGLGCAVHHARHIVYADGLNIDDPKIVTPIGVSCRTCPRTDCPDRASPALSQKLSIDENVRGASPYMAGG